MVNFVVQHLTSSAKVHVIGRTEKPSADNFIILATDLLNNPCKAKMKEIRKLYDLPWCFHWNPQLERIEIHHVLNPAIVLHAELDDSKTGFDYTLIIKAPYNKRRTKWCVIVGACLMYGTQAGAHALTDAALLNELNEQMHGSESVAFIIRVPVVNGQIGEAEIEPEHTTVLQRKTAQRIRTGRRETT